MKPFSDQTHYEILELARDAHAEQIERAYRVARSTYSTDSLATYSVYDEAELTALQERIELAYAVLSDDVQRQDYDATLGASSKRGPLTVRGCGAGASRAASSSTASPPPPRSARATCARSKKSASTRCPRPSTCAAS
jgi:DnaJ-class molecular chaperone